MTTLNDLCRQIGNAGLTSAPLKQACAMPRSAADMQVLPAGNREAPFDSARQVIFRAEQAAAGSSQPGRHQREDQP